MPIRNPDQIDQFNAPIPGEMLTAEMGARPWQRPPQFNTVEEVIDFYTDKLKDPKLATKAVEVIENGVTIAEFAETLMQANVMEGIHNIDVGILVLPFIVELLEYLCDEAGVEYELGLEEEPDNSIVESVAAQEALEEYKQQMEMPDKKETENPLVEEQAEEPQGRGLMARGGM